MGAGLSGAGSRGRDAPTDWEGRRPPRSSRRLGRAMEVPCACTADGAGPRRAGPCGRDVPNGWKGKPARCSPQLGLPSMFLHLQNALQFKFLVYHVARPGSPAVTEHLLQPNTAVQRLTTCIRLLTTPKHWSNAVLLILTVWQVPDCSKPTTSFIHLYMSRIIHGCNHTCCPNKYTTTFTGEQKSTFKKKLRYVCFGGKEMRHTLLHQYRRYT